MPARILAVFVALLLPMVALAQTDDAPDTPGPMSPMFDVRAGGTILGWFDPQVLPGVDFDCLDLSLTVGTMYRVRIESAERGGVSRWLIVDQLTAAGQRPEFASVMFFTASDDPVTFVADNAVQHVCIAGAALGARTARTYTLFVENLGPAEPDDVPLNDPHPLSLGVTTHGRLTQPTIRGESFDIDRYTIQAQAWHWYRLVAQPWEGVPEEQRVVAGFVDSRPEAYADRSNPGFITVHGDVLATKSGTLNLFVSPFSQSNTPYPLDYTLRVDEVVPQPYTGDGNDTLEHAVTVLSDGTPVAAGLVGPLNSSDPDWYTFQGVQGHRYNIRFGQSPSLQSDYFRLIVIAPDGTLMIVTDDARPNITWTFTAPHTGTYRMLSQGGYSVAMPALSLTVTDAGVSDDDYPDRVSEETVIDVTGPMTITGRFNFFQDVDRMLLRPPPGATLRATFQVASAVEHAYAGFRVGSGDVLGLQYDNPTRRSGVVPTFESSTGGVHLRVEGDVFGFSDPSLTIYTLQITPVFIPSGDDCPGTTTGAPTTVVDGEGLVVRDDSTPLVGDTDIVAFDLLADRRYAFTGMSRLLTAEGSPTSWPLNGFIPARTGRHFAEVNRSMFTLVRATDLGPANGDDPSPTPLRKIELGRPVAGTIDYTGDVDTFSLALEGDALYEMTVASSMRCTAALTFPSRWYEITNTTTSPATTSTFYLPSIAPWPWPATLVVGQDRYSSPSSPGAYSVTIRQLRRFHPSEDVPGDRAHAEPMTLGHPITGTINTAEDSDCFRFEAVPGHVYAYSITGGGFRLFDVTDAEGTPIDGPTTVIRPPTGGPAYWCWSVRPPPYVTGPFVYTFNITDLGVLPDDLGNTRVDAAASTLPATLAGTMDYAGDTDAFGITATSGERCYAEALTPGMTLSLERLGWARYFEPHALSVGVPEAFVPGSLQATPGHATIFFSATSSSSTGSAFAVRVWRACPADITRPGHAGVVDGVVNTEDISYFLDAFLNARSPADIAGPGMAESPDGDFTNDDLALYITRYFMGCP